MRKFLTIVFLLAFAAWNSYGQVASAYSFASTVGSYTAITGGTVWQTGTWDDQTGTIPIGFSFSANGGTFTNAQISANGYLYVSPTTTGSLGYGAISSTTTATAVFAGFSRDLQGTASSEIRYETVGTAPNRVLVVQWKDAKRYGSSYSDELFSFQIKLYETTNQVQFVYGTFVGSAYASPVHPQVGLRGLANTDFFNRTTTTNWAASTAGATNTDVMTLTSTVVPANGLTYTYVVIPPGVAVIGSPANAATGILPTASLNWTPGTGGPPSGYTLYFGTDNPPTNIANGIVVTSPTYDPTPDMAFNTTYYWKVVPFNGGGTASGATVWSFTTLAGYGTLEGYVLDCNNAPVAGAAVVAQGPVTVNTTSAVDGKYQFVNVPASSYTLGAQKTGYNTVTYSGVAVLPSAVTSRNIILTAPAMNIASPINVALNPNEYLANPITINNTGCGPLTWTASIAYGSANHTWFTMPTLTGTVGAASVGEAAANFDATGLAAGTVLGATVTFTSSPNVGSKVVSVNMVVVGDALVPVSNLQGTLTSQSTGAVTLTWECNHGPSFLYYTVKRGGVQIAIIPTATTYSETLPGFGTYDYCVDAVYSDGATAPMCVTIEWPNPTMTWTPSLAATVWSGYDSNPDPIVEIGNTGDGTLAFQFPDWIDNSGDSPLAYCAAGSTTNDEFISHVTFVTIDHATAAYPAGGYNNLTAISTDVVKGLSYPISVAVGPPSYTGDITGVWIDYDHNSTFDASEFTALSGVQATGTIAIPASAMSGATTMRVRMQYNGTLTACGNTTYGSVEDYTVVIKAPTFITAVVPAQGFVAGHATVPSKVNVNFSAQGDYAAAGVYVNQLVLESNDPLHASVSIPCTMTVTIPGTISGVVTDGITGEPLAGVLVTATGGSHTYTAMTGDNGEYSLLGEAGTYNVSFVRAGYQTVNAAGTIITANVVTTLNAQMFEEPYAPSCASAAVNADDTQCVITWCVPAGPYELLYDDGSAENYAAWQMPGNMNAVKFTPRGYPAKVEGAKIYIGDGSFPAGGNVIGSTFSVAVYTAAANGMPGTMIDSIGAPAVTALGWQTVTGLSANITSGDFFIVMIQTTMSPNCAPIGVDETQPKAYKSYSRNVGTGSPWTVSPYQDFMMHAIVNSPISGDDDAMAVAEVIPGKVAGMISQSRPMTNAGMTGMKAMVTAPEGYDNNDMVSSYSLTRLFLGAVTPVAPAAGTPNVINPALTATSYTESGTTWSNLAQGWYAYCVKANYPAAVAPNLSQSACVYTNNVPHKMFADVTINVKLVCGFVPAEGAFVTLTGNDYPYDVLTATVPASGTVVFDNVIKGKYDLMITRAGYTTLTMAVTINANKTIDVIMEDIKYKPRNLHVDCGTLVATWEEPLAYAVQENFEGGVFPPAGWQATTQGSVGWYATTDGGSAYFAPPSHTTYAIANDDEGGSANNGCCDYLTTPELDLTGAPSYVLSFQSYFDGGFGQMAYVEMSTDAGASWTPIYTCSPATSWQQVDVDLSAYSGTTGLSSVWFTFHADDAGQWASGWAIDDVVCASGGVPVQGYGVFLDATQVGQTNDLTWTFDPSTIMYGQTYVAGVAGMYCSGFSELETYTFTSCFLYPPRNLQAVANNSTTSGATILTWEAPLSGDYAVTGSIPRTSTPSANAEYSPMVTQHTGGSDASTAVWDILLQFQCLQAGNAGVETDGTFIYVTIWSGGGFRKFDLTGAFVEDFSISGVNSIRDLAYNYNNSHMYGSNNSNTLYEMDFTNKVLIGSVNSPGTTIRHISYNENLDGGNGGFYVGEWASLRSIKMDGSLIANAAGFGLSGAYGSGYDPEGNKIWIFDQGGNGIDLVEFDAETMTATGNMHDASLDLGIDAIAGGLAYTHLLVSGQFVMLGLGQDNAGAADFVFEYSMGESTIGPGPAGNLLGYRMYRNDQAIVPDIPKTELTYWDLNLMPDTYCYDITAVYDLTPYNMPGQIGESVKEGTACVDIAYGFELPFNENWTAGQFDVNLWTVGENWIMDGQAGNPLPSAKFKWDPLLTDYSSSLESFYMNATTVNTTTPYKIWLDFDLKLDDRTASTNEKLSVEVWNGSSWNTVKEYANNGDLNWGAEPEHINISAGAKNNVFKVRFRANGTLSGDIFYWAIDNINIYVGYEFNPPLNLVANREGTPQNDIKLTWNEPEGGGTVMSYILDDNTAEDYVYFTSAGEGWLGNEFAVTDAGVLQSASVNMESNGVATYSIDIFDASQTLVGSSATFVPTFGEWTNVALPDIPFNGTFYVMLHMVVSTQSDGLNLDYDGPNAAGNYEWYYDGASFAKLTDFGFTPCVTFVRATGLVGDKKTQVTFEPGTAGTGYVSPLANTLAVKESNKNTGMEVAHATPLNDNSDALSGYNVYRRAYAVFPAGQNTAAAGTWEKINPAIVVPNEYLDMNLSNLVTNCYEYRVTAVYDEGESDPTNVDWDCIFVGVNPNEATEVKVYPNPATTYVRIDLTKEVTQISIYNSLGSVIADKNVKGETTITINTANYAPGAYSVKFSTANGESFSRKFVVTK